MQPPGEVRPSCKHRYPCGSLSRRQFLGASAAAVPIDLGSSVRWPRRRQLAVIGRATHQGGDGKPLSKLAAPGLYPGQVVEVTNPRMFHSGIRDAAAIKSTLDSGMKELTGATDAVEAWKHFFEPGDVVGIKVVPNGQPDAHSSFEIVLEVIEKLKAAGVKTERHLRLRPLSRRVHGRRLPQDPARRHPLGRPGPRMAISSQLDFPSSATIRSRASTTMRSSGWT